MIDRGKKKRYRSGVFSSAFVVVFSLLIFSLPVGVNSCSAVAGEKPLTADEVERAVSALNFLSDSERRSFSASLLTSAKNGLLNFSGALGTRALLEAVASQPDSVEDKTAFVKLYRDTLKEDLPVFLITKTSIRLMRRNAPLSTVLRTAKKEKALLDKVDSYLQEKGVTQYLTFENRALLVSTLAESLEIYARQRDTDGNDGTDGEGTAQLEQTLHNLVKFSGLPVSLGQDANVRGGSSPDEQNEELEAFLTQESTISELAGFVGLLE